MWSIPVFMIFFYRFHRRFRLVKRPPALSTRLPLVYKTWAQQVRGEDHGVVGDREPGHLQVDAFSMEFRCESDLLEVADAQFSTKATANGLVRSRGRPLSLEIPVLRIVRLSSTSVRNNKSKPCLNGGERVGDGHPPTPPPLYKNQV